MHFRKSSVVIAAMLASGMQMGYAGHTNSYFADDLSPATSYSYSVEAVDTDGNYSARSAMLPVVTD